MVAAAAYQVIVDPKMVTAVLKRTTDAEVCPSLILDHFGSGIYFFISTASASHGPCCFLVDAWAATIVGCSHPPLQAPSN